ncbi:LOW QUALITY PROTEIN: hypothetical protein HID58_069955, partial [Brassica napus]
MGNVSNAAGKEIEEGELVENWEDVLLTPSRFSALIEVDEKGDTVNQVEYEEILSVEEEIGGNTMDEELGKKETKDESSGVKEIQEETTNDS